MELLGWIGALAFAFSAVPQAYKSYKEGHSDGISAGMLSLWLIGEILTIIYVVSTVHSLPLIFNYTINLGCLYVIIWYKLPTRLVKSNLDEYCTQDDKDFLC